MSSEPPRSRGPTLQSEPRSERVPHVKSESLSERGPVGGSEPSRTSGPRVLERVGGIEGSGRTERAGVA